MHAHYQGDHATQPTQGAQRPAIWPHSPARTRPVLTRLGQTTQDRPTHCTLAEVVGQAPASQALLQTQRSRARLLSQDAQNWRKAAEAVRSLLHREKLEGQERQLLLEEVERLRYGARQHEALAQLALRQDTNWRP